MNNKQNLPGLLKTETNWLHIFRRIWLEPGRAAIQSRQFTALNHLYIAIILRQAKLSNVLRTTF